MNNITYGNNFIFTCGRLDKLDRMITSISIPTVSLGETIFPTRTHDISTPGNKMTFDPINVEFMLDENFDNYKQILDWMNEIRAYTGSSISELMDDATLEILSNNATPIKTIKFKGIYPTVLTEVLMSTQNSTTPQSSMLTLALTDFVIV